MTLRLAATEPATFGCAVNSAMFRPCRSSFSKRLKPGRYTIAVAATDRFGNRDATPAITTARVRKPRRR